MENHFYTRNAALLDDPAINILFEESMSMSDDEFSDWTRQLRKVIAKTWDEGIPPRNGLDEQGIIRQLDRMSTYPVHEFLTEDILTGDKNVIRNETNIGNVANQWYPGMLQTRIAYSKDLSKAKSVYDWVIDDSLHERFLKYVRRHYQRDGFYHYSLPVRRNNEKDFLFHTESGEEWVKWFEENKRHYLEDDYWLAPKRLDMGYTGAAEDSEIEHELFIPKERISDLPIPESSKCNMGNPDDCDGYQIRYYKLGQKIFPLGLKTFRVSFCQYAVNFPPLTARYLYERYTEHIKDQDEINIYDPSMGWGGRILGAMAVKDDRNIQYIGTDPNTDHNLPDGSTKYSNLADFYNTRTNRANSLFPHTNKYAIFQLGSEVIGNDPDFQKYRGKLDMVFTSPPYFAKEIYSDDPEQSAHKFDSYDTWRDGFLRPTLKTAVEFLRSDRYLLWNIANCIFDNETLPLETDSRNILEELGMEYVETLKMSLSTMPGGNRVDEEGKPRTESFVRIKKAAGGEMYRKYEAVFVYRKP
jgi:hypothetical protein